MSFCRWSDGDAYAYVSGENEVTIELTDGTKYVETRGTWESRIFELHKAGYSIPDYLLPDEDDGTDEGWTPELFTLLPTEHRDHIADDVAAIIKSDKPGWYALARDYDSSGRGGILDLIEADKKTYARSLIDLWLAKNPDHRFRDDMIAFRDTING